MILAITLRPFDELNDIKRKPIPIRQYFEEMKLPEYDIERRIALAEELQDELEGAFEFILATMSLEDIDEYEVSDVIQRRFEDALDFVGVDPEEFIFLANYIQAIADDIARVTVKHIEEPYYTSSDRATNIAENEANTIYNDVQFKEAKEAGNTHKTWITMRDLYVRDTHSEVDGETIPIDDLFVVGDSLMYAPRLLFSGSVSEIVGCRCSLEFSVKSPTNSLKNNAKNDKVEIDNNRISNPLKMDLQFFARTGADRSNQYRTQWTKASLKDVLNKYNCGNGVPNAENTKLIFDSADNKYQIVYDPSGDYFRIQIVGNETSRKYADLDGNMVLNKVVNGVHTGITKTEYQKLTHFANTDNGG